jgi:hypothetical protein
MLIFDKQKKTMEKLKPLLILIALTFIPGIIIAQFSVSAELRPRFEMDNGAFKPRPDSMSTSYYVTQRTRLKFDFKKEKYQLRLTLQDVRFWGTGDLYTSTGVFGSTGGLDIQEAWFRLKLCDNSNITIGRQVLQFDDQRLIATRNWNQWGVSYDAVSYSFLKNDWNLNIAVSYNTNANLTNGKFVQDTEFFDHKNLMKTFNYIHVKKSFNENLRASLLAIGSGYQSSLSNSVIYMMGTYGLWLSYNKGVFDISTNLYYQNGKAQSGKDVSAFMATLHPGVTVKKIRLGLGGDYISGDNANNEDFDEKERTFNKMYGAVFKYYGYMNYYSYMKASTANGGLIDLYPNIKVPIKEKHSITALYHKFYLANPVFIGGDVSDNEDLGSEVDLMYTFKAMKELVVQAGVSYYFTTNTLKQIKKLDGTDINSPYWAWVMLTFKPQLFSTK